MREILQMDRIMEKLTILSAAARYDVACTSSGVQRGGDGTHTGLSLIHISEPTRH